MRRIFFFSLIIVVFFSCSKNNVITAEFNRLLCDYAENPINITNPQPEFSWVINTSTRDHFQIAYQILVASEASLLSKEADLWNTGKVSSDQTLHIPYQGKELESNNGYFWMVIVWDNYGNRIESKVNHFATAFLINPFQNAEWIGANKASEFTPDKGFFMERKEEAGDTIAHIGRSVLLRKEFAINKPIKTAKLFITGLGFYESKINGRKVGDFVLAPGKTPYHKQILYDTYDVTDYLKEGNNAIGIHLGNGWYDPYKKWWAEYRMQWFGYKKAVAKLYVKFEDGSEEIISTDSDWKTKRGPVIYNCVYDGEIYDANLEQEDWSMPVFDDSDWDNVVIMKKPEAKLVSQTMPSIKINEVRKPVKVTEPKAGMKVYDFGQNFTGWVRLSMKGQKGTVVKIRFSEELYDDGTLNFTCNENAKATVEYIMKGGEIESYQPRFTYFGFQYAEITTDGPMPEITDAEACVIYSANPTIGSFISGNELINKMHHAAVWSQKSNMLSYPMDCPQRDERLGWMGDAQVTAEEAMYNFNMALFYQNWFSGIRDNQDPGTGDIPIISPRPYIPDEGVEWSSSYINMVWNNYLYYGDSNVLRMNFNTMKRYMDFLNDISENYILPKGWIGDWGSMVEGWQEGEPESVPTAYYYYNAVILSKIAGVIGEDSDEVYFSELAENIKRAYNKTYFRYDTNNYNDGSQMANAFPLYLGLVPKERKSQVLENLIYNIEVINDTHLTTGVLGTKYLIDALAKYGRSDVAWALATQTTYPSWAEMMKRFNTMCEFWTLKQSHNHVMMGSIDAWFYNTLAGIQLSEEMPAYKEITIKPFFAQGLDSVSASVNTVRGVVSSKWRKTNTGYTMDLQVPFNCRAVVYIPNKGITEIYETDKPLNKAENMEVSETAEGKSVVRVSSGVYHFEIKQENPD